MTCHSPHRVVASALVILAVAAGCSPDETDAGGAGGAAPAPLDVMTDKGPVQGALAGSTRTFFGIPYAAPPVGDLRWKPPAPHAAWSDPIVAAEKGAPCAQMNPITGSFMSSSSEDCLTVNVWTPERPANAGLPVLVWIHGGAFVLGSGGEDGYDGQHLSEASGAVVITLNYRLGPLGFLALPELRAEDAAHPSTGGYGIEDQRAALSWVKANAAAFGGDPANVTIFGESAGGISVCHHMVSPGSAGLFQRAIIESGPCDTVATEAEATAQGEDLAAALGCAGGDALACLRGKSAEEILGALPGGTDFIFGGTSWYPMLDGWNLPGLPSDLLAAGAFEKVPVILGANASEGSLFFVLADAMVPDDAAFEALAEQLVPGHGAEVVSHYPSATYGSSKEAAIAAVGDAGFVCPTRRAARAISAAGAPAFLYHFTYDPGSSLLGELGAFHSAEVKYVFGNPGQLLPQPLTEEESALSAEIMGYWSRHAAGGDPNGDGAPPWPAYDAQGDENVVLDVPVSTQAGLKKDLCDFWDGLGVAAP